MNARVTAAVAGMLFATAVQACSTSNSEDRPSDDPTVSTERSEPQSSVVSKLLVLVVENHSLREMRAEMPFLAALADRFGYATDYNAVAHPSLPNYLAITSGSTNGVSEDRSPAFNGVKGSSVFGLALQAGRSARIYSEGMPENCALEDGGDRYVVRHNPWAYYVDERVACERNSVALSRLTADAHEGHLPEVGMIVPNTCHDAHDCGLATADDWLRRVLRTLMSGPDWAGEGLAIVITADEDDHTQRNHVLTVVVHPDVRSRVVDGDLDHYSLARALFDVAGVSPLGEAGERNSLLEVFGLG